jgi:hypothetical protein
MDEAESSTHQVNITSKGSQEKATFQASDNWLEYVDGFVESEASPYPTRSAAVRSLTILGIRALTLTDPRQTPESDTITTTESDQDYEPTTIRELIPEGQENAVEFPDELLDSVIKGELIDVVYEDPEIERDGGKVYRR